MAYSFASKEWTISGEYTFNDQGITLLNPVITPRSLRVKGEVVYVDFDLTENGGVYKHGTSVKYTTTTENNINDLVDDVVADAFPTATVVA